MHTKKYISDDFAFQPFKDLKKNLKKKRKKDYKSDDTPEPCPLPDDERAFQEAMSGVREITEFRDMPLYQKASESVQKNRSCDNEALAVLEDIITGKRQVHLPDTPEYVEWINPHYREDIAQRLHEGRYSVQDFLDLHGRTAEEAEIEIGEFINSSMKNGLRCIKLIHGRGLRSPDGPVLKQTVVKLLKSRFRKRIIAFASARQCDGGLGALYILLRF